MTTPKTSRRSIRRPGARAKLAHLARTIGKHKRLEVVRRKQGARQDINVRFAKPDYASVKAAAKRANESLSLFIAKSALERAATNPQMLHTPAV